MGLEKRMRSAAMKNEVNMLVYSSILQDRRREGREGGHERMPRPEAKKINKR
jgi:hypothetical protein